MIETTRLRTKNQLTLPTEVAKAANLAIGDPVGIEVVEGGILLRPLKFIDASQAWFWTQRWQAGELSANEDIAEGRVTRYESGEDFLNSLTD